MSFGTVVNRSQVTLKFLFHTNFCWVTQVTRVGRVQVIGWSLIGCKSSQVSGRSVANVSRRSGRGYGSGDRVNADILTNGVRGSRARKSVVVQSQVTLITWPIIHFLFTRMSVAPDIDVNANLWYDDKSLTTAHESEKSRMFQLVNRS